MLGQSGKHMLLSVRALKPAPYEIGAARDERAVCQPRGLCHTAEFAEVETGKGYDARARRPQLAAALHQAKRRKCSIVIAKLHRLSRDVHFIGRRMTQKVPLIVAELGPAVDPRKSSRIVLGGVTLETRIATQR
jgi:hypothetical protein